MRRTVLANVAQQFMLSDLTIICKKFILMIIMIIMIIIFIIVIIVIIVIIIIIIILRLATHPCTEKMYYVKYAGQFLTSLYRLVYFL